MGVALKIVDLTEPDCREVAVLSVYMYWDPGVRPFYAIHSALEDYARSWDGRLVRWDRRRSGCGYFIIEIDGQPSRFGVFYVQRDCRQ